MNLLNKKSHPKVIQISDRFYLLKNLTDYRKSYITKIMNFKIKINRYSADNKIDNITNSFFKKNDRIKESQSLYSRRLSQKEIRLQLRMDIRTVKKYIDFNVKEIKKDAPRLFELGEEAKTVHKLLGHSSLSITVDTYTHVLDRMKEKAISKLDKLFVDME
jgi:hypothetical protein